MQTHRQFILLRGHQGSGKTTFAQTKIAAFQAKFPHARIVWLENDALLTDEQGAYHFSPEALQQAIATNEQRFQSALQNAQKNPQQPTLIINSNTNQNAKKSQNWLDLARKAGFGCEVYRLHDFYPNQHDVPDLEVMAAYWRLNRERLAGEIDVPQKQPMSATQSALLSQVEAFQAGDLPFDAAQQTFVTPEYLQLGKLNFIPKTSKRFPELTVFKYKREIFYRNQFDAALLEMRGLVMDKHGQIIVRPFKKVFNYSERVAENSRFPIHIQDDKRIDAVVKINGFLGVCTYVDLPPENPSYHADFNQQILYSTTGSLDSDFARMTEAHCQSYAPLFYAHPNTTFLFEINDESDPHIIKEPYGATLIGAVEVRIGKQWQEHQLDALPKRFAALNLKRPDTLRNITFGELKALLPTVQHEGFMVFDHHSQQLLFKLKSPYYLISKFLGRSRAENLNQKLDKRHVDEEFYPLIDAIKANQSAFNALSEQEKITWIQQFLRKAL